MHDMKSPLILILVALASYFFLIDPEIGYLEQYLEESKSYVNCLVSVDSTVLEAPKSIATKNTCRIRVYYGYDFNGRHYTGSDIAKSHIVYLTDNGTESIESVWKQRFPSGKQLMSRVNPMRPEKSSIPDFHSGSLYSAFFGVCICVACLVFGVIMSFLKRRERAEFEKSRVDSSSTLN